MGTISNTLKNQLLMLINKKVIDINVLRNAKKDAKKNLDTLSALREELVDIKADPLSATYISIFTFVSTCMYSLANTKELKEFSKLAKKYEDIYMPSYPPMSPHSDSYYTMWEMLDLPFGPDNETLCGIFLDLADTLKISSEEVSLIKTISNSRMGIYLLCEINKTKNRIKLKELVTNKEFWCLCTSGYKGKVGQLWYIRLLPPIDEYIKYIDYHVTMTTPYILLTESASSWNDFFKSNRVDNEQSLHNFMKFGLNKDYWNEFIFYGYCNFIDQAIFLAGLPNKSKTLPCHDEFNERDKLSDSFNKMLLVEDKKKILSYHGSRNL